MKIVKGRVSLKRIVSSLRNKYKFRCKAKGIQLKTQIDPELRKRELYGCEKEVNQIMSILISNSIKFTAKGYIKISAKPVSKTVIKVSVIDTGVGMSEKLVKAIREVLIKPERAALFESPGEFGLQGTSICLGLIICNNLSKLLFSSSPNGVSSSLNDLEVQPFTIKSKSGVGTQISFLMDISRRAHNSQVNIIQATKLREELIKTKDSNQHSTSSSDDSESEDNPGDEIPFEDSPIARLGKNILDSLASNNEQH